MSSQKSMSKAQTNAATTPMTTMSGKRSHAETIIAHPPNFSAPLLQKKLEKLLPDHKRHRVDLSQESESEEEEQSGTEEIDERSDIEMITDHNTSHEDSIKTVQAPTTSLDDLAIDPFELIFQKRAELNKKECMAKNFIVTSTTLWSLTPETDRMWPTPFYDSHMTPFKDTEHKVIAQLTSARYSILASCIMTAGSAKTKSDICMEIASFVLKVKLNDAAPKITPRQNKYRPWVVLELETPDQVACLEKQRMAISYPQGIIVLFRHLQHTPSTI
ncbi:hypothetical protein AX17_004284 [Amanita inopinata Kibby_2008]|nr:hypothetical protein AX17_004284 [Amanita inopinata Kibby_2008]